VGIASALRSDETVVKFQAGSDGSVLFLSVFVSGQELNAARVEG